MTDKKIAYEPHPVTPARKAELIAAGFKIIDAVYAPKLATESKLVFAPLPDADDSERTSVPLATFHLSDDELRDAIKAMSGKAAHHKAGRDKLVAQYNAMKAAE